MGAEAIYSDIYDRIAKLNSQEKELRDELVRIRTERENLKSQCNVSYLISRPKWVADLPREFWYPAYTASSVLNDLNPNMEQRNIAPDLTDWQKTGGLKEFVFNIGVTVVIVYFALQLVFILL
jgi:hypothetical protein